MNERKYLIHKNRDNQYRPKNTTISQLLKKAKDEEDDEKRKNIYMAAAAVSVLALSGFIISQ